MRRSLRIASLIAALAFGVLLLSSRDSADRFWTDKIAVDTVKIGKFSRWIPTTGTMRTLKDSTKVVVVAFDEFYLLDIKKNLTASSSVHNRIIELIITEVDTTVVDGRFTAQLEFVESAAAALFTDPHLRMRVELKPAREAMLLRWGSYFRNENESFLFVVNDEWAFKRRVKLGEYNLEEVEVIEGLQPGEVVITSSYERFNKFDSLRVGEITERLKPTFRERVSWFFEDRISVLR